LHAESRFETFMTYTNTRGLRAERHVVEGEDVPATILRTAAELGSDLLFIGTRGRSDTAAVLLGSVAEKVVRAADVPTVAVKRKGATLSLLDALFEL
ncbi:MAG: universal stress protein, partial [Bacteroidota bacterium]